MIISFNRYNGGGGSSSAVTPEQVQQQIDSALTPYWDSAITESAITAAVSGLATEQYVQDALSGVSLEGYWNSAETRDAISAATSGKADAKTLVDFDHTSQAERASIYAELKTLYDGGSGATINKNYDFFKTVNTWQGLKIDYYSFSGGSLVFGKVVSPENLTDQIVYEQVMTIDAEGNVAVVTNSVGGVDLSGFWTSAETKTYVDSAVTDTQNQLNEISGMMQSKELVISTAFNQLNDNILELSARTVDFLDDEDGLVISTALNDLKNTKVSSSSISTIWKGTQAEYDLITTKDPATFYIIVSSN